MRQVTDRVVERLEGGKPDPEMTYFVLLSVFHEDMHTEAFTYTRQTLSYPAPRLPASAAYSAPLSPQGRGEQKPGEREPRVSRAGPPL